MDVVDNTLAEGVYGGVEQAEGDGYVFLLATEGEGLFGLSLLDVGRYRIMTTFRRNIAADTIRK